MKKRMIFVACAAAALLVLTACGALAEGKIVLPEAEDLERVTITASELDLVSDDADFIGQLLEMLELNTLEKTGRASVQNVPDKGAGLVRIDFGFQKGGDSTLFLYREGEGLFLEQPYQGIYEMDSTLESLLRQQIALELARQETDKQE